MTRVCQIVGGHLECCEAMEAALNPDANSDAKGLNALIVSNWKTGTSRFWCVTYRERDRAGGIALNVCPWCGESILPKEVEEMAAVEGGTDDQ